MFDFGIIGFSDFGEISNFNVYGQQEHQYGFQIESDFRFNKVEYEWAIGYLTWTNGRQCKSYNYMEL